MRDDLKHPYIENNNTDGITDIWMFASDLKLINNIKGEFTYHFTQEENYLAYLII